MKKLVFLIVFYAFISCDADKKEKNESEIEITELEFIEGFIKISNEKTKEFQEGYYLNGFKDGLWEYDINGDKWTKDWSIYKCIGNSTVSIPFDWEILDESNDYLSVKGDVFNDDEAQVIILVRTISDRMDEYDTNDYREEYVEDLSEKYIILEQSETCFNNSDDEFQISKFHLQSDDNEYFCFALFHKIENKIIETSYYFQSTNFKNHYNMFFDFVNGIKLGDNFITNHNVNEFDPMGFVFCGNDTIQIVSDSN